MMTDDRVRTFVRLDDGIRNQEWDRLCVDANGHISETAIAAELGVVVDTAIVALFDCWRMGSLTMVDCGETFFFKRRIYYWGFQ